MLLQTWKVVTGNSLGSSLERSSSVLFVGHEWWRKLLWVGRRRIVCYQVESVSCCESCCRTRQLLCVIWESTFAQWEDAVLLKVVMALECLHHGRSAVRAVAGLLFYFHCHYLYLWTWLLCHLSNAEAVRAFSLIVHCLLFLSLLLFFLLLSLILWMQGLY